MQKLVYPLPRSTRLPSPPYCLLFYVACVCGADGPLFSAFFLAYRYRRSLHRYRTIYCLLNMILGHRHRLCAHVFKCTLDRFNRVSRSPSCKLPQSWHAHMVMICPLAQAHDLFLVWLPRFTDSSAICLISYNCKSCYSSFLNGFENTPFFFPRRWRRSCLQRLLTRSQS